MLGNLQGAGCRHPSSSHWVSEHVQIQCRLQAAVCEWPGSGALGAVACTSLTSANFNRHLWAETHCPLRALELASSVDASVESKRSCRAAAAVARAAAGVRLCTAVKGRVVTQGSPDQAGHCRDLHQCDHRHQAGSADECAAAGMAVLCSGRNSMFVVNITCHALLLTYRPSPKARTHQKCVSGVQCMSLSRQLCT